MKHRLLLTALALINFAFAPAHVSAEPIVGSIPTTMPADTKLVVFNFDPNASYTILARPNAITNIQLGPDEQLISLAMGDTVNWITAKVDGAGGHIFIKPIRADLFTSGTLVTNKRTYQLTLRSVSDRAHWYQRVSWQYPDMMVLGSLSSLTPPQTLQDPAMLPQAIGLPASFASTPPSFAQSSPAASQRQSYERLNFDYAIEGKASFRPSQVFDDGQFTWIKIPHNSQEMPAVFMISSDGEMEIVNFVAKGDYIMVQRLAGGFMLKLGKQEVRITKKA